MDNDYLYIYKYIINMSIMDNENSSHASASRFVQSKLKEGIKNNFEKYY